MSIRDYQLNRPVVIGLLAIILVVGFSLRVWNVNFDRGIGSHPDERSTACFYATTIHLPQSWDQFWDEKQSPLNPLWDVARQEPRRFTYGHFPLYLGVAMGELLHRIAPLAQSLGVPQGAIDVMQRADASCDAIAVAGRLMIALLDTFTIFLLFLLGRRMFSPAAGLMAAAFYAFTAQAIQLSHFFAMDPASATFTVLAIYGAVMMVQERSLHGATIAGVAAGLAISSKFSALPILLAPLVAGILVVWHDRRQNVWLGRQQPNGKARLTALVGVAWAYLLACVAFFVTSPYAVLDWSSFIQATLVEQGRMVRGVADMPFTRQYRNTIPYIYFIRQQIEWGLWWPLGTVAALGTLWAFVRLTTSMFRFVVSLFLRGGVGGPRLLTEMELANIVVWSWVLPYFVVTGAFLAKFNRYMIPILPFTALFAAGMIWMLWSYKSARKTTDTLEPADSPEAIYALDATQQQPRRSIAQLSQRVLAVALCVIGIGGGLFWSVAYVNGVYGREHTWITASHWIYENAPEGSVLLWELWDDPLPKSLPGEPEMNMGAARLRNIDWAPYEEDTPEKYETMKEKLREADYVVYSSKRIYDSVDELPERYPLTTRYYNAMWDGRLGFELAVEMTSPPKLFGLEFDDRHADESWSLYDHPQVTIFRKVRELSDPEYDALFGGSWETAIPYYRGKDSPLSPILSLMGLGNSPESAQVGLLNRIVSLVDGQAERQGDQDVVGHDGEPDLLLDKGLGELPLVDNYRWNRLASENTILAIVVWWLVTTLVGVVAWPLYFWLLRKLRDRGYFLSRTFGWLLGGWTLWILASAGILQNNVRNAWLIVLLFALVGGIVAVGQWQEMRDFLRANWAMLVAGEALFGAAFLSFILIRMANPDLWQPWFGGEKFMEFAFLNGILRSPTFPPVDPHFAGGYINYYYFGLYLVAYLIKLTGIYAEVAFNLVIPFLFALTVINAFVIAYSAWSWHSDVRIPTWRSGFGAALFAPLFVAIVGNLDGFAQIVRGMAEQTVLPFQSSFTGLETLIGGLIGLGKLVMEQGTLPAYDFWGPSRVIPNTINEFPYWSFLFADLHPHLIGIPFALMFLALVVTLLAELWETSAVHWTRWSFLLLMFSFALGTLASVNLWELPTYLGIGALALIVGQYWASGRIRWMRTLVAIGVYLVGAYGLYLPFLRDFVNVGASGIGFVREGDDLGVWLLIWGLLGFVLVSWIVYTAMLRPQQGELAVTTDLPNLVSDGNGMRGDEEPVIEGRDGEFSHPVERTVVKPTGIERAVYLLFLNFDRLPRLLHLHTLLVRQQSVGYLLNLLLIPATLVLAVGALLWGRSVLALCLAALTLSWLLLWRRGAESSPGHDAGALFVTLCATTGFAILAGTQVVYLRDFLQGGDWYRMNTLFKFFSQVWVFWGVAAGIALPRLWNGIVAKNRNAADEFPMLAEELVEVEEGRAFGEGVEIVEPVAPSSSHWLSTQIGPALWAGTLGVLLIVSITYLLVGTPARLSQRLNGWRPAFGTLNGLEYMREGRYTWPDENNVIELAYDWEAINWLLDNVRGNAVLAETSEVDYYRAGSTRVASMTGLSGLRGMHESEQRYGDDLAERDRLHKEFWSTPDNRRRMELIDELDIALIYAGQLERYRHPEAITLLEQMAEDSLLQVLFQNDETTIYAVPGSLQPSEHGYFYPVVSPDSVDVG